MNKTPLAYVDGETLLNTVLPPIRFVIPGLLPQGLHVLAGAPKAGKPYCAEALRPNVLMKKLLRYQQELSEFRRSAA